MLTCLQSLKLLTDGATIGPSSLPRLTFPASLKTLLLSSKVEAGVLSLVPAGLQQLWIECDVEGPAEGPSSLLSCLARFQHLTDLVLQSSSPPNWPPAGPAYSALTASTNLAALYVAACGLPSRVWPFVFPSEYRLPQLTYMCHHVRCDPDDVAPISAAWDAADVSALVRCCPNLSDIAQISLRHGDHVSELHKLTALTSMKVSYCDSYLEAVRESLNGLATITQLQQLSLSAKFRVGDLLPLTNLTALTSLDHSSHHPGYREHTTSCLRTRDGSTPDVWLQLLEQCAAAEPGPAVRTLALQLTQQQQQLVDQQQQNAAQQEQIARQDRQLSAQQQVAADQGALIVGLQGQLQEVRAEVGQLLQHQAQ